MTEEQEAFQLLRDDSIRLVEYAWGLKPQPLLPEYEDVPIEQWEAKHFGHLIKTDLHGVEHWEWPTFVRGEHLTWQQVQQLYYINQSKLGGFMKIAVAAGRGIGKTFVESIIIHWALIQCRDSQGAATSYSRELLYDILWKELAKTHRKAKAEFKALFEWSATRFSIKESQQTWFISSKTGKKENPEALAGMHGEFVLLMADEASGVPDEIFETALDGLTEAKYLVFMASNWRRLTGFFHKQCKSQEEFKVLQYNSLHSPLYDVQRAIDIAKADGIDSDRYKVEVLGQSPDADQVDKQGWVPLLNASDIRRTNVQQFAPLRRIGLDPAGGGKDKAVWVLRDNFRAKVIAVESMTGLTTKQAEKLMAETSITLMREYKVAISEFYIDSFGVGSNVGMEMVNALEEKGKPKPVNVGEDPEDKTKFLNMRAEAYWRVREWLIGGGELLDNDGWDELLTIRWKYNLKGRIQIMPKELMKNQGLKSPNVADALMLTFIKKNLKENKSNEDAKEKAFKRRIAKQVVQQKDYRIRVSSYNK